MKKSRFFVFIVVLAVISIAGTYYFVNNFNKDKFIGVFITTESVSDESGNEKIYAQVSDKKDGEFVEKDVTFKNLKGIRFMAPTFADKNGESTTYTISDPEIINSNVDVGDRGTVISGEIYTLTGDNNNLPTYFFNEVYQESNGRIYISRDREFGYEADSRDEEGEMMTFSTIKDDKKTDSYAKMSIYAIFDIKGINIYQMDKNNTVISKSEIDPSNIPESIKKTDGAEYVVVEYDKVDLKGNKVVTRDFFEKDYEGDLFVNLKSKSGKYIFKETSIEIK